MSERKYGSMMNKHISKTKLIIKRERRRGKGCIARVNCAPLSHCAIGGATICSIKPIGCNQEEEQGAGGGSVQSAKREPSITCLQFPFNHEPSAECSRMATECKNRKWKWKMANAIVKSKPNSANDTHKSPHPPSPVPPPHVIVNSSLQL